MLMWLLLPVLASGQEFNLSPTYAGEAAALRVRPWGGEPATFADTGPAPEMGGERQNSAPAAYPAAGIAAHELYAVTLGVSGQNKSQSSLTLLDATIGSHRITALWIEAQAKASAGFLSVPTSGKCTFAGLTVDGHLVAITGQPNQTITFPDGFLVINEQTGSSSAHFGTLTVNALHLQITGVGSLIAASAKAEVINGPTR
jgi:hypothetical protein